MRVPLAPEQGFGVVMDCMASWKVCVKLTAPAPAARALPVESTSVRRVIAAKVSTGFCVM